MVHLSLSALLPLALLATAASASAAPPNPDQLYKLQASVESVAATATAQAHRHPRERPQHGHKRGHKEQVKRHLEGAHYQHHRRAMGMQRRPASERRLPPTQRTEDVREKRRTRKDRRGVVDSSSTPDEELHLEVEAEGEDSDLEARDGVVEPRAGEQYFLATSSYADPAAGSAAPASEGATSSRNAPSEAPASSSPAWSSSASSSVAWSSSSSSAPAAASPVAYSSGPAVSGAWHGVSSYFLFALSASDRAIVLDAIQAGGFKVVRIFVASVLDNNKGCGNSGVNDLEHAGVGIYDDTILEKIDQLMVECKDRGLKLMIALSDRYALGYWSTDAYALKLNIVQPNSSGAQKVANAAAFYTSSSAIGWFDNRLKHIMQHKNGQLGGRTWAELDDVIYAVEPQNEPQGHMAMASSTWACDRAALLKSLLPSGSSIKVSSGGGITTSDSLGSWATSCSSFDVISVHDYGTSAWSTAAALAAARDNHPSKEIVMGEWGMTGANKAALITQFREAFAAKNIPWMYWQITKPGAGAGDFEIWTSEDAWHALTGAKSFAYSSVARSSTTAASNSQATYSAAHSSAPWSSSSSAWHSSSAIHYTSPAATTSTAQWHSATSSFVSRASSAARKAASAVQDAGEKATSAAASAGGAATSAASWAKEEVKSAVASA
ncbi:hypothetical protein JCM10213_006480 [Rhodosporidiobolus nylandii]